MRTSSTASIPSARVDDARATHDDVVVPDGAGEHHATSTAASTATGPGGQQVVEHRHPHDEARAHLVDDERRVGVGDARVDLDAAVHRAGVHDASGRAAIAPA